MNKEKNLKQTLKCPAPLLCGFVSKTYGGYYNSLLLIIVTLTGGIYLLYQKIHFKQKQDSISGKLLFSHPAFIGTLMSVLLVFLYFIFKYHSSFNHLMAAIALGSMLYFGRLFYQSNSHERRDLLNIAFYILLFAV